MCNDGLVLYSGSAHFLSSIEKINFQHYGLIHTGGVGDGVLGSLLLKPKLVKPKMQSGAYSTYLLPHILPKLKRSLEHYESNEMFKLYNRAFNGALNGTWTACQFTESASPFLDAEFMKYCFSIPPSMRYKEKIYI